MPLSEEQLVAVLLREQPRLLAFLNALVRHETLADDLFQDLSLKAVHARPTIETEKHFVYWLYRTARHRAIDELRKAKIPCLDDRVLDLMEADWSEPHSAGTSDRAEALGRCLELLQPAARRLVEMRYDDGLSGADIA
ncbi:MAG: RNA polymerase sigma factor, partial [Planctomycetota bacterium]